MFMLPRESGPHDKGGRDMTRRTAVIAPPACRYCGQPLVDEEALRRVERREQERLTELRQIAKTEAAGEIGRLKTELRRTKTRNTRDRETPTKEAEQRAERKAGRRLPRF